MSGPQHPWQFSLRALLVVVTVIAAFMALAHYFREVPAFRSLILGVIYILLLGVHSVILVLPPAFFIWLILAKRKK